MATRLYFHNATYSGTGTFPSTEQSAATSGVAVSGATTLRTMDRAPGTSQVSQGFTTQATTAAQTSMVRMFASPPLKGNQTITATTTDELLIGFQISNISCDMVPELNVYVWRPSTGAKVGTIYDGPATNTSRTYSTEDAVALSGTTPTSFYSGAAAHASATSVSALDGDIIVIGVWAEGTQSATTARTWTLYYDGTTTQTTTNTSFTSIASYFEFSTDFVFTTDPASTVGPNNPSTASGTGWTGTGNVFSQDSSSATIVPTNSGSSPLDISGFGFSIPSNANVQGIQFDVYASQSSGTIGGSQIQVNAQKADGTASTNSLTSQPLSTTAGYLQFGSQYETWGNTWTGADINDVDFGLEIIAAAIDGSTSTSATFGATTATTTSSSGISWSNTGNVTASDGVYATQVISTTSQTAPLLTVTNFGFSIPTGATILGVTVAINGFVTGSDTISLSTVNLVGTTVTSTNRGGSLNWTTAATTKTVGGVADLWGNTTITPAQVNSSSFGARFACTVFFGSTSTTVSIDYLTIAVTYTVPGDRQVNIDHARATVFYNPSLGGPVSLDGSISESQTITVTSVSRSRPAASSISESESVTATKINRVRPEVTSISESESLIDAIIRTRNAVGSIVEAESITASTKLVRAASASINEAESVSESVSRTRPASLSISETETASVPKISRSRPTASNISEAESLSVPMIARSRPASLSIAETEVLSPNFVRSVRGLQTPISEAESVADALIRSRKITPSINEAESLTAAAKRARNVSASIAEAQTLTVAIRRTLGLATTIAELEALTADITKQGQKSLAALIGENETLAPKLILARKFTFNITEAGTESLSIINRARPIAATNNEAETLSPSIARSRTFAASLAEIEAVSSALRRARSATTSIAEIESVNVQLGKLKAVSFAITQAEAISPSFVRGRGLIDTITEAQTMVDALARNRKVVLSISESETVIAQKLNRTRAVIASLLEAESITSNLARARQVIGSVIENEDYIFTVTITKPSGGFLGITVQWYESELVNGVINQKLMTESWLATLRSSIVTVDVSSPATQVIDIRSQSSVVIDIKSTPNQSGDL